MAVNNSEMLLISAAPVGAGVAIGAVEKENPPAAGVVLLTTTGVALEAGAEGREIKVTGAEDGALITGTVVS